jgi:DnaK suppressor protein
VTIPTRSTLPACAEVYTRHESMNSNHFKQRLQQKEKELLADIARLENDARAAREAEVEDPVDKANSSEGKAASFQESSLQWQTLVQVRAALERLAGGSYGRCTDCGRQIERSRLDAIPWTPYCREDQEKHDQAAAAPGSLTL